MIPALFMLAGGACAGLATLTADRWRASSNRARGWLAGSTMAVLVVYLQLLGLMIRGPR